MWMKHGLRGLLWLTMGVSGALVLLLSMAALWIMAGGLLTDAAEYIQLTLMCIQAVALLGVTALAAGQAANRPGPRWWWLVLCPAEALATAATLAVTRDMDAAELALAVSPLICAVVLTGLCMLLHPEGGMEES